jgi:oxygen-independent coproporphyrinogen-3 oxidase
MKHALVAKYNVPGPRYTSYPTVPYWDPDTFTLDRWHETLLRSFKQSNRTTGLSLYLHLPYCERLCTFCGCNKRITRNHQVERPYIESLLKEWDLYRVLLNETPRITELHLGGGTPTFFSAENLEFLIKTLLDGSDVTGVHEFSLEANPNYTNDEHLAALSSLGFTRLSLGVQDFDPAVQTAINRIQPYQTVAAVTEAARANRYTSINYDLVYGLPLQREASIIDTISKVSSLRPDRIAFYSYAHVPWIKGLGQRKFSEEDLPRDSAKRALYELGRSLLEQAGYHEIGMDHFALTSDALYQAAEQQTLHRNFMGYTPAHTELVIGLGVSSISDSWYGYAQNEKKVEDYQARVNSGVFALFRGHILTEEDLILRRHILNVMCHFETSWHAEREQHPTLFAALERMQPLAADGLVTLRANELKVTDDGLPFLRNICMALDARLWRNTPQTQLFSQVI